MSLFFPLLFVHIVCGFTALSTAALALATKKGADFHRAAGRLFVLAMTGILFTAIPLSYLTKNIFLFLIALFSYYLAISGYLYAKHRDGKARIFAWLASILIVLIGLCMIVAARYLPTSNDYPSIVLDIFGVFAITNGLADIKMYYQKKAVGRIRITKHLSAMLGATIATITAFTVVNITTHPAFIAWIAPTVVIVPVIYWWRYRINSGKNLISPHKN
jgi:uncharacterized membrane protein